MEGDSGIVMENVCGDDMQNLRGRLVLMFMRAGILVGRVVVVVVGVMVIGEVGVVSFSEGGCLPVAGVERLVVGCGLVGGDVLNFSGDFVAVVVMVVVVAEMVVVVMVETVVGGSKLEIVVVVRIVWSCVNGELYSLCLLSQASVLQRLFLLLLIGASTFNLS